MPNTHPDGGTPLHPIRRLGCRAYQLAFRVALPVLPYRQPDLLGSLEEIPPLLASRGIRAVLLVADGGVYDLGLTRTLEQALDAAGIACAVYLQRTPTGNATRSTPCPG